MSKLKDLTGQRFGRLTVIKKAGNTKDGHAIWECHCDCGNKSNVSGKDLRKGHTQSCGCLHRDILTKNLIGKRFGRLLVVEYAGIAKDYHALWKCICDCGNEHVTSSRSLLSGNCKSCGCLASEVNIARCTVHEMSHSKIYNIWAQMKKRCRDSHAKNFQNYGGRGIKVCDEWCGSDGFIAFYNYVSKLEHFGEGGYSLDRIDVNGNYEPGNVRWATVKQQARNKRDTIYVEYNGKIISLKEAAEQSGISYYVLGRRWRQGIRGTELFRPQQKLLSFRYNGEEMTLKEAARRSGISYRTLLARYKKGKRGDELFDSKWRGESL